MYNIGLLDVIRCFLIGLLLGIFIGVQSPRFDESKENYCPPNWENFEVKNGTISCIPNRSIAFKLHSLLPSSSE
jgi:hypothetical protein